MQSIGTVKFKNFDQDEAVTLDLVKHRRHSFDRGIAALFKKR